LVAAHSYNRRTVPVLFTVILGILITILPSCGGYYPQISNGGSAAEDQILNYILTYIKQHHSDAAPFIKDNLSWQRSATTKKMGYSGYTYTGDSWIITIGHPITAEEIFDLRADYGDGLIIWSGIFKNNAISEIMYSKK
jgi:hypothetical protein